jgi:hypothetical protein
MPISRFRLCRLALLLPLLATSPALAQDVPTRNGNVWDGQRHEPTPGAVQNGERAAGIAVSPQRQRQQNDEVEQLNDELQLRARRDVERPVPPAP